jgi:hypothetical protein
LAGSQSLGFKVILVDLLSQESRLSFGWLLSIYFIYVKVFLGQSGGLDAEGNELPRLVYVSREKRPGFQHHKKAGAMNALVSS